MPSNGHNYPASMKTLPEEVRRKAIEIANALLEKGDMSEGIVIATAIKHAKQWARRRGSDIYADDDFGQG